MAAALTVDNEAISWCVYLYSGGGFVIGSWMCAWLRTLSRRCLLYCKPAKLRGFREISGDVRGVKDVHVKYLCLWYDMISAAQSNQPSLHGA